MPRQPLKRSNAQRPDLVFCATGKSGLGHLRRITNVVTALTRLRGDLNIHMISNAEVSGLSAGEAQSFAEIHRVDRAEMAAAAMALGSSPIIVDTATLPGLEKAQSPLCLILRETVADRISAFNLDGGRNWDLVCIPNPADHWMPGPGAIAADRIAATGWIFRPAPSARMPVLRVVSGERTILVASGGGGNAETAAWFKREVDTTIALARQVSQLPLRVVQAIGPRLSRDALLEQADECIEVGSHLNEEFARYDAVISTVGYNSVLELAQTDAPVLLVPILRSLDDQAARAKGWAPQMGHAHDESRRDQSAAWLAETLLHARRRPPCRLDGDGASACARLILDIVQ